MERILKKAYRTVWKDGEPRAAQIDEAKFLSGSLNARGISGSLKQLERETGIDRHLLNTHTWMLPCNNGMTYDLETGQVIESKPAHLMTGCVPWPALKEPGEHPKWDALLNLTMGGDAKMVCYLRTTLGLFTTGYTGEKAIWFWNGEKDAGKTTLLMLLTRLLGPDFVYGIPLRALLKHRQDTGILHDIAGVRGMRLVYAEEFKPGDTLDSGWIKKLTGQGDITADRKNEPNETFHSTAKLVIGTNTMPALDVVDSALRGRVRVVPFPTNVPAELKKQDKPVLSVEEVIADVLTEAPAILYDLVQAVREYLAGGRALDMPQAVADASERYLDSQDLLVEWLDVCCEKDRNGKLTTDRVEYPFGVWYWSFIIQSGQAHTRALFNQFGGMLRGKGFDKRSDYRGVHFTGPALVQAAVNEAEFAWQEAKEKERRRADEFHDVVG
jgi:putative DNA primase/helicase